MDKYIKIVSINPYAPQGVKVWVYGKRLNIADTMIASKYFCGDHAGAIADIKKLVRKQRRQNNNGFYYYYSTAAGDRCILQGAYFQRTDNIHARNAHFQALKDEVKKRKFKAYSVTIYNERFKGFGQRPLLERVTWQSAKHPQYKIVIVYDYWQRSTIELYQQDNKIFSKPEYRTADIAECGKIILENLTK